MRTDHSTIWFHCMGGAMWLAGAGFAICWMVRAGGLIWPAVAFSLWVTVLAAAFVIAAFVIADSETGKALPVKAIAYTSLKHGLLSGLVVLLGSLFVEFWPVTASMACLFAIGRSFESDSGIAYN